MVTAYELGLTDLIELLPANAHPVTRDKKLVANNPLGKVPTFITDDGQALFDSRVICEYLNALGHGRLLPAEGAPRWEALTLQALGDGIMDAAILIVYEARHRPAEIHHKPWLDYQRGKIERALARLALALPDPREVNVGTIATACMLGYLDWRKQVDWRSTTPALIDWLISFRAAAPAFDATEASGT
jgi:glutathione S-transferase